MEYIIKYLTEKYKPEGIICYGSFSDGTNDEKSDFDALVIAEGKEQGHDGSTVNGVLLDVFLNSPEYIKKGPSPESYLQLYDGKILLDKNGLCAQLLKSVREYVDEKAGKSAEELEQEVGWCEKMLRRAIRGDAEGCYRLHWLLVDSLEIYFDITGKFYFGPKKSLRLMEKENTEANSLYFEAISTGKIEKAEKWIAFLRSLLTQER